MRQQNNSEIYSIPISDPIAQKTDWTLIERNPFGARRFARESRKTIAFKPSNISLFSFYGLVGFPLFFVINHSIFMTYSASYAATSEGPIIGFVAFYLLLLMPFIFLLYPCTTPVVFDIEKGIFSKGRQDRKIFLDKWHERSRVKLNLGDIYALQILYGGIDSDGDELHQLNVIDRGAQRIVVNIYGKDKKMVIKADANALGAFLEVPIWEAIARKSSPRR